MLFMEPFQYCKPSVKVIFVLKFLLKTDSGSKEIIGGRALVERSGHWGNIVCLRPIINNFVIKGDEIKLNK